MKDSLSREKSILRELYAEVLKTERMKDTKEMSEGMKKILEDSKTIALPEVLSEAEVRVMFEK